MVDTGPEVEYLTILVSNAGPCLRWPQVTSVSDKPWLADRQPSDATGCPQVTTGPAATAAGKRPRGEP